MFFKTKLFQLFTSLFITCLFSPDLLAQEGDHADFRFGVLLGQSNFELGNKKSSFAFAEEKDVAAASFYVGYQKIKISQIGYSTAFTISHLSGTGKDDALDNIMLEGNATYGVVGTKAHFFGGLNISRYGVNSNYNGGIETGAGIQLGFGGQATAGLAYDIRYIQTRNDFNRDLVESELISNGYRLGLLITL